MSKFLIDSTIWIEFFKGHNNTVNDFVLPLIDEDKIYYSGIILSELLVGASNEREFSFLESNFEGFRHLETDKNIFAKTAQMGFKLRRKGVTVPLTDLIIAAHAAHFGLTVVTADPHFKLIDKEVKLDLQFMSL
jgi:predicted nucleic acid-binding protein